MHRQGGRFVRGHVVAAPGWPQHTPGPAARRAGLDPARGDRPRPLGRTRGPAQLSAIADGDGVVAAAVVQRLRPRDRGGALGSADVPALRGARAARPGAGPLDDQPFSDRAGHARLGRATVRRRERTAGRHRIAGQGGHAHGRDAGGGAGPPALHGGWAGDGQRDGPGRARAAGPTSATRHIWGWTRGRT